MNSTDIMQDIRWFLHTETILVISYFIKANKKSLGKFKHFKRRLPIGSMVQPVVIQDGVSCGFVVLCSLTFHLVPTAFLPGHHLAPSFQPVAAHSLKSNVH